MDLIIQTDTAVSVVRLYYRRKIQPTNQPTNQPSRHSRYVHRVHWLNDRQNKVNIHHGVIAVSVQRAHWLNDRQNKNLTQ